MFHNEDKPFVPTNDAYTIKLNNLEEYIKESGVSWSKLDSYTTGIIEAQSTDTEI